MAQPCATNPAAACSHQNAQANGWVEFHLHAAVHWCHHLTADRVQLPSDKKGPVAKREWEHYDR